MVQFHPKALVLPGLRAFPCPQQASLYPAPLWSLLAASFHTSLLLLLMPLSPGRSGGQMNRQGHLKERKLYSHGRSDRNPAPSATPYARLDSPISKPIEEKLKARDFHRDRKKEPNTAAYYPALVVASTFQMDPLAWPGAHPAPQAKRSIGRPARAVISGIAYLPSKAYQPPHAHSASTECCYHSATLGNRLDHSKW